MTDRRAMMIQMGARRNYAAARALEKAGLLSVLVSDSAWPAGEPPRLLSWLSGRSTRVAGAVARRGINDIPADRIRATVIPTVAAATIGRWMSRERFFTLNDTLLGRAAPAKLAERGAVIVNVLGNGGRFLDRAHAAGAVIVTDFISHPDYWRIVAAERARHPGWEVGETTDLDAAAYRARIEHLVDISDFYLCPSQSVADGLGTVAGYDAGRVRIAPYGPSGFVPIAGVPVTGRVLFAANRLTLAKGLLYFAEAAMILRRRLPTTEFVVAGALSEEWRHRAELDALTFLGPLAPSAMAAEFARADVFCLPSLAEGSASVAFEAMANGLPVITTAASGTVVRNGVEGIIVPSGDAAGLATAISAVVGDRAIRDRMAAAARTAAIAYAADACDARFLAVVNEALALADARRSGSRLP